MPDDARRVDGDSECCHHSGRNSSRASIEDVQPRDSYVAGRSFVKPQPQCSDLPSGDPCSVPSCSEVPLGGPSPIDRKRVAKFEVLAAGGDSSVGALAPRRRLGVPAAAERACVRAPRGRSRSFVAVRPLAAPDGGGGVAMGPMTGEACVCGKILATKRYCGTCKTVYYCGSECQKVDWPSHKARCRRIVEDRKRADAPPQTGVQLYGQAYRARSGECLALRPRHGCRVGVRNVGNTCYVTSVIQALTYSPLAGYLQLLDVGSLPTKRGFNMMFELAKHTRSVWASNEDLEGKMKQRKAISTKGSRELGVDSVALPTSLMNALISGFHAGRMEDAHECLTYVLAQLLEACAVGFVGKPDEAWERSTVLFDVFGFDLVQAIVCANCQHALPKSEAETSLRLNATLGLSYDQLVAAAAESPGLNRRVSAPAGDDDTATTVDELLRYNFAPEPLDGYSCDHCKKRDCSSKRSGFGTTPNSFVMYVSRCGIGGMFGKLTRRVGFEETLNLQPFLVDASKGECTYSLDAVVVHLDVARSTFFGHYVCYTKDGAGRWWFLDDDRVTQSTWEDVRNVAPLLLFYRKDDPHTTERPPPPLRHAPPPQPDAPPDAAPAAPDQAADDSKDDDSTASEATVPGSTPGADHPADEAAPREPAAPAAPATTAPAATELHSLE